LHPDIFRTKRVHFNKRETQQETVNIYMKSELKYRQPFQALTHIYIYIYTVRLPPFPHQFAL
jgi:hypothetical protein